MTSADRRRNPRFAVDVPVEIVVSGETTAGRLHDICRDAVFVETEHLWPEQTELALAMRLPGTDGPVEARGRVVRVATGGGGPRGLAVVFTETTPTAVGRIDLYLDKQS